MEMKRVAKWKLIESKTVRNSLVIWFMENVNHTAIIQHVPISNRLTHLTYDSLCHIAHAHFFSWSNHETSVQQSWFTWHTFNKWEGYVIHINTSMSKLFNASGETDACSRELVIYLLMGSFRKTIYFQPILIKCLGREQQWAAHGMILRRQLQLWKIYFGAE